MDKFIAREKMSKKARKEMDSKQRAVWGISPVTRKAPDKKHYNRKRNSRPDDREFCCFWAGKPCFILNYGFNDKCIFLCYHLSIVRGTLPAAKKSRQTTDFGITDAV